MSWFKLGALRPEDEALIAEVVKELSKDILPKLTVTRVEALSVNKATRAIEKALKKLRDHQEKNKIRFLRKVKFIHSFRWKLDAAGYSKEFVELMTESLLAKLVQKNDASKTS